MKSVIIIGNSVTAEVVHALLHADVRYDVKGFAVDREFIDESSFCELPVTPIECLQEDFDSHTVTAVLAIGYKNLNQNRDAMAQRVLEQGFALETYIHPQAFVSAKAVGEGTVVFPGVVLDPYVSIGKGCVLWSNVTCAHHSRVEDNCWIASGATLSGNVEVGHHTFVGVGATVVNDVHVGAYNIIGAQSLITQSTKEYEVYLCQAGQRIRFDSKDYARVYGY